jgi:hypothetical protein
MDDDAHLLGGLFPSGGDSDVILMPLQLESTKRICLGSSAYCTIKSAFFSW